MMTDLLNIDSHGTAIRTEVFHGQGHQDAAIVLAHGSDGMTEPWAALIREYAADLANQGFLTVVPGYFAKTRTVP